MLLQCEASFTPQAWGRQPPVKSVKVSHLNTVAYQPPEFVSRLTAASTNVKAMHPVIKLQPYDGLGSLETFLMKFHRMADYTCDWTKRTRFTISASAWRH